MLAIRLESLSVNITVNRIKPSTSLAQCALIFTLYMKFHPAFMMLAAHLCLHQSKYILFLQHLCWVLRDLWHRNPPAALNTQVLCEKMGQSVFTIGDKGGRCVSLHLDSQLQMCVCKKTGIRISNLFIRFRKMCICMILLSVINKAC